eukprot:TRINITY_DN5510_c0_g1_i1.p1 TRINITY_DN5510_c0_g1~~TRINITY_DN5510_c0_g1_i1.p1  ORF type:complete len:108 (+),score=28.18 TRINITY_DN5510_c0_g1_i1:253-576(+)
MDRLLNHPDIDEKVKGEIVSLAEQYHFLPDVDSMADPTLPSFRENLNVNKVDKEVQCSEGDDKMISELEHKKIMEEEIKKFSDERTMIVKKVELLTKRNYDLSLIHI